MAKIEELEHDEIEEVETIFKHKHRLANVIGDDQKSGERAQNVESAGQRRADGKINGGEIGFCALHRRESG